MRRNLSISYLWSAFLMHNTFISKHMSDETYLKQVFRGYAGYPLNLSKPTTYNEKLQWLKLYDIKPIYTTMVDKCEAKKYAASIIGEEFIIPTLGVWDKFDDIDFDVLPNQFVLKCTHDSGGLVICKDKSQIDIEVTKKKINKCLERNFFWEGREWPYKNIKPRIIAEKYMEEGQGGDLKDYKYFVFNGEAKALFIASDRQKIDEDTKFDFFDMNYKHLNFTNGHPNACPPPEKPINFEKMRKLTEKLASDIPELRVDFYEVNGSVYFGELTFFHWSGLVPFEPEKWDEIFGSWIVLPDIK